MARGIEKRDVFAEDQDRDVFLRQLADLLGDEEPCCLAWALMPNHFHLLLRTPDSLATLMRRLLTRYAMHFNKRYGRHGHLFQNRYKSIVVEEDTYLCTVVCYIHANPLRAGLVPALSSLSDYRFCGHRALVGTTSPPWQDVEFVLQAFGGRDGYLSKMSERNDEELDAGGQIRCLKLEEVNLERPGESEMFDERACGSRHFVESLRTSKSQRQASASWEFLVERISREFSMSPSELLGSSRGRVSVARSVLIAEARRHGYSGAELARLLHITESAVAQAVRRKRESQ